MGRRWTRGIGVLCLILAGAAAHAVGPTEEEEALADLNAGRWPLQTSRDGQWLVHLDAQGGLVRRRADAAAELTQRLAVPPSTYALSASRTAAKVALLTAEGCVGVATFPGGAAAPSLQWLPPGVVFGAEAGADAACQSRRGTDPRVQGERLYRPFGVALSADGNWLALQGRQGVHIVDTARMTVVQELPIRLAMHLQFVDDGRRLFAVSALMGEGWESPATGSHLLFSVWNLAHGELLQLHHTDTRGSLRGYDMLWSFEERSGVLWAQRMTGAQWRPGSTSQSTRTRAPAQPYRLPLKRCGAQAGTPLSIPAAGEWLEFAVDPRGRWLAAVEAVEARSDAGAKPPLRSRLSLWDARRGKLIASRVYDGELRSLVPSADGAVLHGMLATPAPGDERYGRPYRGASLQRYEVDRAALLLPADPDVAWDAAACRVEDEAPDARNLASKPCHVEEVFDLPLTSPLQVQESCIVPTPSWGQSPDGSIWIDRGAHLERIDPASGRVAGRVATPRSALVCSAPSFARQQFLSWQGDTVTLRDFTSDGAGSAKRVLAAQPGWRVESARWLPGGRVGVRWVEARLAGRDDAQGGLGTSRAAIYEAGAQKLLREVKGRTERGGAVFDAEAGGDSDVFDDDGTMAERAEAEWRLAEHAPLVWKISHFGSVRAQSLDNKTGQLGPTVLWDGLSAASRAAMGGVPLARVIGLGGSLGLAQAGPWLTVYDAATHSRIARLQVPLTTDIAWNRRASMLLLAHSDESSGGWRLCGVRLVDRP